MVETVSPTEVAGSPGVVPPYREKRAANSKKLLEKGACTGMGLVSRVDGRT
jgi:hypothetical protein